MNFFSMPVIVSAVILIILASFLIAGISSFTNFDSLSLPSPQEVENAYEIRTEMDSRSLPKDINDNLNSPAPVTTEEIDPSLEGNDTPNIDLETLDNDASDNSPLAEDPEL